MKTLTIAMLLTIHTISFAQINSNTSNQIVLSSEKEDGITILNWESNKEVNSSYYLIEKSINGENFETIATQKAGSSTYQNTAYYYEDVEESNASTQYRITLILMDGTAISTQSIINEEMNLAIIIAK